MIYKAKRKNNRVDAGKLARLLYLNEVPTVYVPGKETRLWRQIAIVATAHYLTRVAVSMIKSGEVWREDTRLIAAAENEADPTPDDPGGSEFGKKLKP